MIKRYVGIILLGLVVSVMPIQGVQAKTVTVDEIGKYIKGNSPQSKAEMVKLTDEINKSSQQRVKGYNPDEVTAEIYADYTRSLIEEALYHMERLEPYYRYKEALLLKKLQELKKNREQFEAGEINQSTFQANVERIKKAYQKDLEDTRNYISDKIDRLKEICEILKSNEEDIKGSLNRGIRDKILALKGREIWIAFSKNTEKGRHIRKVIMEAPNGGPQLVSCLENLFAPFEPVASGAVLPASVVKNLGE